MGRVRGAMAVAVAAFVAGCVTSGPVPQVSAVRPEPVAAARIETPPPGYGPGAVPPMTSADPPASVRGGPDAVAVVIGNRSYRNPGVPEVEYARRDAEAFDRYLKDVLGYRDGNVIDLRDATQAEMEAVLGNGRTHQGRLWQLVKPGKSDVAVYYSGHGAPGQADRKGYLLPSDADPERPEINGYPVDTLVENVAKLGARTATVYLDACFSGTTPKGSLIKAASGIYIAPKEPAVPKEVMVLTAGQADQVASWDSGARHGLFTTHLLDGLYGKADRPPYGNGDGKVAAKEAKAYLDDLMTYAARREFGRTQVASLHGDDRILLASLPGGRPLIRPEIRDPAQPVAVTPAPKPAVPAKAEGDTLFWSSIKDSRKAADYESYLRRFPDGTFAELAKGRIEELRRQAAVQPPQAAPPQASYAPPPKTRAQLLFVSETAARQTCPGEAVVWVNTDSGIYHYPGQRHYGQTKKGAFMCERSRGLVGARPSANGQ